MKLKYFSVVVFAVFFLFGNCAWSQTRDQLWVKASQAQSTGLPATAIEHLKTIYELAVEENDMTDAAKALCEKIVLEGTIQGNRPEEKIVRLENAITEADESITPLLNIVLARWYWQFYNRNRFRFINRTQTEGYDGKDFTTWDLPKLFSHISEIYQKVLEKEQELKKIPICSLEGFLDFGNQPRELRPTLFDFFAHEALKFYIADDQSIAKPARAFEIEIDSPAFKELDEFLKWSPEVFDESSSNYKALVIFQKIIKHAKDTNNTDSKLDNDLLRLKWARSKSVGEQISENYIKALEKFANENQRHVYSARALGHIAREYSYHLNENVKALQAAKKGMQNHPNTYGARLCEEVYNRINTKSLGAKTENSILPSGGQIKLTHRNIDKVYLKLVKRPQSEFMSGRRHVADTISWSEHEEIARRRAHRSWNVSLERCDNYGSKETVVDIPKVEPGMYYIVASTRSDFIESQSTSAIAFVNVSEIAMLTRNVSQGVEVYILDAKTGQPLSDINVTSHTYNPSDGWHYVTEARTNSEGFALFNISSDSLSEYMRRAVSGSRSTPSNGVFMARHGNSMTYRQTSFNAARKPQIRPRKEVTFFTDRALYRPGQTVYVKGILTDVDSENNKYEVVPYTEVEVSFRDPNNQEVTKKTHTTNEHGSFSISFIAPRDRLTGNYSIRSQSFPGQTSISIEEYKRPQFKVDLITPTESYRLEDTVKMTGHAIAYTGANIDGASVRYRVVRKVQMPRWFWWYVPVKESQEIAHGTAVTDREGKFEIQFTALADRSVPRDSEPVFVYSVNADVTDGTGETRSASQDIRVGYTAMSLNTSVAEVNRAQQDFDIRLTSQTHDGESVTSSGNLKIYKLNQPDTPVRKPYLSGWIIKRQDESQIKTWEKGSVVLEHDFSTTDDGSFLKSVNLPEGAYRVVAESKDRFGNNVRSENNFMTVNEVAESFDIKVPFFFHSFTKNLQPGDVYRGFWATGYTQGPARIEVEHRGRIIKSFWTETSLNRYNIEVPVTEEMRGGFIIRVMQVKDNREYALSERIDVPWKNKELDLQFIRMSSTLEPGQSDRWIVKIKGDKAHHKAIEMLAAMYDASLDAYREHNWMQRFNFYYRDSDIVRSSFSNGLNNFRVYHNDLNQSVRVGQRAYPSLPISVVNDFMGYAHPRFRSGPAMRMSAHENVMESDMLMAAAPMESAAAEASAVGGTPPEPAKEAVDIDLDSITARENLNETAFFKPHLTMDEDGYVKMEFTVPEALTTWNFMAFAHGKDTQSGSLRAETVTRMDLMVQPNPPRFFRERDKLGYTARVTNLSDTQQSGMVRLNLLDPVTEADRNSEFNIENNTFNFTIPAGESRSFTWMLEVPDTPGIVKHRVVAGTGQMSDGQEGLLPILSRRIFITESMPLPIRGPGRERFRFDKLVESAQSDTLQHMGFTVEATSNPAWYAVQALPYLMNPRHNSADHIFKVLYSNALAAYIANSDPKIRRVFNTWKMEMDHGGEALLSHLERNEHLKSVALQETPWLLDAKNETEQKHLIGTLFEQGRMEVELKRSMEDLRNFQLSNGAFPWFPKGRKNAFVTLYIMCGFGRLRNLGVDIDIDIALKTLEFLDEWIDDVYRAILDRGRYVLSPTMAMYLYARTFFIEETPIPASSQKAFDYFVYKAERDWLKVNSRMAQGHIALALYRLGQKDVPTAIVNSIRERSVTDDEMGRFWREGELSVWWYRARIETQALMIELFDEVANDHEFVEECKVWLLKQKQTQNWNNSNATTDAIYALLLRGSDLLASDKLVRVALDGKEVRPERVEAGTGYYQKIYSGPEVKPEMGNIQLFKEDEGVAWGAVHWQYLEDISKVTPHTTNLQLKKELFVKEYTDRGPVIKPVKGSLRPGDALIVRIQLRSDRDMEYVHLKDQRGSGLEPVDVISGYRWQDGLAYYQATMDTATHFYIDYLPKGVYVFEYEVRVQHQGRYQSGIAEIQCLYAPEFNSHSESFIIEVKD